MQSGDRLLCAFVSPQSVGLKFADWPLHVTVVSWFRTNIPVQQLEQMLTLNLEATQPFTATVGDDAQFGTKKNILVSLVEEPTPLGEVEQLARLALESSNVAIVAQKFPQYRPHVTVQRSARLQPGDNFFVDRLNIVEQKGDYKQVVGEVLLGNG